MSLESGQDPVWGPGRGCDPCVSCRSTTLRRDLVRTGKAGVMARHEVSPGEDVTPRVQTKTLRSEWIVMRQSHPFQEEMMRKMKGWTGLRAAVVALGLVAGTATWRSIVKSGREVAHRAWR